jgi:cation-transporting P-type ATPase E
MCSSLRSLLTSARCAVAAEPTGLTAAEVAVRIAQGRVNRRPPGPTRTLAQILRANILNPVNGIMLTLFAVIMLAGFPSDGLFVGVVVSNAVIGIAQELKARRELRRLEVLNAPSARVRRDGHTTEVDIDQVVADDLIELTSGDQLVVDGEVLSATGLEIDESLLTGESETVVKFPGDHVMSGSFVVAGNGCITATNVGADSYANQLATEATEFKLVNSELRAGINQILRWLIVIIPPASLLLLWSLMSTDDGWRLALQGTVAAAVAMVPDGLVLLTSLAFVAGIIALTRRQALAKELATVELLARVDTLCLDKTGTITTGEISFGEIITLIPDRSANILTEIAELVHSDPHPNPTMAAIAAALPVPTTRRGLQVEPFSSARKWAAVGFGDGHCVWLGAPEVLIPPEETEPWTLINSEASAGRRVLAVVEAMTADPQTLPTEVTCLAVILLDDTVRPDAPEILRYFVEQQVQLRIISGDSVATVAAVAARAGVPRTDLAIDARTLPEDPEELAEIMATQVVFGRVTPHQKRAMVEALQSRNKVVAMTGDGVNDVLALKRADLGIAMGTGSAATRAVADLVLLDNHFSTLPTVLAEGRKVINNIERVASLFVTKAIYAVLLTAVIGLWQVPFPLLPRHLTLIGTFSIGIPGFFLALAPSTALVQPGFLRRVLRFSIPAGIAAGTASAAVYALARRDVGLTLEEARTATALTLLGVGLVILVMMSRPLNFWKLTLAAAMAACYAVVIWVPALNEFFELDAPPLRIWGWIALAVTVAGTLVVLAAQQVPKPAASRHH